MVLVLVISSMAVSGTTWKRIKIDTVPDEYTPTSASVREPVSMQAFRFEVNVETGRARVVVDYTYPDAMVYEKGDDNRGPQPTLAQLPGLKYLPQAQMIVYETDGHETVCALVQERKRLFGTRLHIKNTGLCRVTAEKAKHAEDDGWQIRRFSAIDTYFEVR